MVSVTLLPVARPELLPVITSACPCSMILTTSSPATVSTRRPGRFASMVISRVPLPVLPTLFVTEAEMVSSPLPNACSAEAGTLILQLKFACTVAVYVVPPSVTVTVSPAAAPVTCPLMLWPAPASAALIISSLATTLMVTPGSAVLTCTLWLAEPLLPSESVAAAVTV